jgi:hypothetical protein
VGAHPGGAAPGRAGSSAGPGRALKREAARA